MCTPTFVSPPRKEWVIPQDLFFEDPPKPQIWGKTPPLFGGTLSKPNSVENRERVLLWPLQRKESP